MVKSIGYGLQQAVHVACVGGTRMIIKWVQPGEHISEFLATIECAMQENGTLNVGFQPDGMHGGALLAVRGTEFVSFYDWEKCKCVRRIDVTAENIFWNPAGDMLAIVCKDSVFVLKYHRDIVASAYASGGEIDEDGVEEAFEVITEVQFPSASLIK